MSGENRTHISGWTVDVLKAHFDDLLTEYDKRYEQRFTAQQKAVQDALAGAALAVDKAEANSEKWRQNANEWRGTMMDREAKFLTRSEFQGILSEWVSWRTSFEKDYSAIKTRLTVIETKAITWAAAIVVFFTVFQAIMFWLLRK